MIPDSYIPDAKIIALFKACPEPLRECEISTATGLTIYEIKKALIFMRDQGSVEFEIKGTQPYWKIKPQVRILRPL